MRCERWRKPLTTTKPNDETMNMPPVSMPVSPELVISIMTMALMAPSNGTSEVSSVLTPSLGSSSGGGCSTTLPLGVFGPSSLLACVSSALTGVFPPACRHDDAASHVT